MVDKTGMVLIHVAYFTTKSGKRLYASAYGKKCWTFWVKKK